MLWNKHFTQQFKFLWTLINKIVYVLWHFLPVKSKFYLVVANHLSVLEKKDLLLPYLGWNVGSPREVIQSQIIIAVSTVASLSTLISCIGDILHKTETFSPKLTYKHCEHYSKYYRNDWRHWDVGIIAMIAITITTFHVSWRNLLIVAALVQQRVPILYTHTRYVLRHWKKGRQK